MLVQNILSSKENVGIFWLTADEPVKRAVAVMSERRIGTIIVSEDGEVPTGILSERDIVREMGKRGAAVLEESIDSMMTKKLVTCSENDMSDAILQKMTDGRFRHMPVLRDGKLVGLISIGDVVKARLAQLAMEKDALEGMVMGR